MALMKTPEVNTGWKAVDFKLPGTDGKTYRLADVKGPKGLVVMFIANHCPYVQAIVDKIARDMAELKEIGVGSVAISANDVAQYPEDSPASMKKLAEQRGFVFPYLYDETQEVALAYDAVCTPDFFGFNAALELQYRGRLDASGMNHIPSAERELYEAMKLIAGTGRGPAEQHPSMGCSIKWKEAA